jgi:splicing factor 3B subunit 2
VPRHWCYKRKYLQGKRGIEKAPFELPDFIRATGIEDMRAALQEKVRVSLIEGECPWGWWEGGRHMDTLLRSSRF